MTVGADDYIKKPFDMNILLLRIKKLCKLEKELKYKDKCLEEGEDFDNWIKYLSKYMGHESTEETMYYLHMVEALIPEYQEKIRTITEGIEVAYEEF